MYDGTMKNVRQQDTATEIQITRAQSEDILSARINQKTDFVYNAKTGELKIGEETFVTDAGIRDFSLLFDDMILEMTADCGTITGIFELPEIAEKLGITIHTVKTQKSRSFKYLREKLKDSVLLFLI